MVLTAFIEGPLLLISWTVFLFGILLRLGLFLVGVKDSFKQSDGAKFYLPRLLTRILLPFHMNFRNRPLEIFLRYLFHLCLIVTPVWLSGHIVLWEESWLELSWSPLPDSMADVMAILVICLSGIYFIRRIFLQRKGSQTSLFHYFLPLIAVMPFVSGYIMAHDLFTGYSFVGDYIATAHILSGELMIVMVVFLFCKPDIDTALCLGCTACNLHCPAGAVSHHDEGNLRFFMYHHYQCIVCGTCVRTCPEDAVELVHEFSFQRLFNLHEETGTTDLSACTQCGAIFAPAPLLKKITATCPHDFIHLCLRCRITPDRDLSNANHGVSYYKQPPSGNNCQV